MRILYSCHGVSLDLFFKLNKYLKKEKISSKSGFIVSNKSFYEKNFLKKNPNFEEDALILKEWEIFNSFKKDKEVYDLEILKNVEKNIDNNFSLFDTIISDRRIFCGKNSSFFQDYKRRYNDDELYSLIFNYYKLINDFVERLKPDILINFLPVNLFDYVSYLICKKKNIKINSLRSCKIKNFVFVSESFFDPSPELIKQYGLILDKPETKKEDAKKFLENFEDKKEAFYEGATKPSNEPALRVSINNYINFFKNFFFNFKNNFFSTDPQSINFFKSYFYNGVFNKLVAKLSNQVLAKNFEKTKKIIKEKKFKLCFFPMHTEPEVSLLCYSKPFLNQIEVIRQIALSLPIDYILIVKEHPWSVGKRKLSYYQKILNIPRVYFVPHNYSSRYCIDISDLVITLSSSIGQEAVFLKKPVITFGKSNINVLSKNLVTQVNNLTNLTSVINDILRNYKFLKNEVLSFIQANFDIGVNVDLYTSLLQKKNAKKYNLNIDNDDISTLGQYFKNKVNNEK